MREVHLLLVEDSPTDRLLAEAALAETWPECRVHTVDNGLDALDFLHQRGAFEDAPRPDLVLLDLNLPGLDGRSLLRRMKAHPTLRDIPVVVLTVSGAGEDVAAAYRAQASSYIEKPVDFDDYRRALINLRNYWSAVATLPRAEAEPLDTGAPSGPLRVLILADESVRRSVEACTAAAGADIRCLEGLDDLPSHLDGLERCVLVVDVGAEGRAALERVRHVAPDVPVVAVVRADDPDLGRLADDFVVRQALHPITTARAIEVAIERQRTRARLYRTQQLELLARLAGNVAHDFNNLLTVIRSGADVLRSADLGTTNHVILESIEDAASRGEGLTRQLLALGRRRPAAPVTVDTVAYLHDRTSLIRRILHPGVELVFDLDEDTASIRIDPARLDHVVFNLVSNASDAMPEGGRLTVSSRTDGGRVALSFADTGEGIAPDDLEHVFLPFFTTKPLDDGSGLGLASVQDIVRRAGGDVRVESDRGRGATFTLDFPAAGPKPVIAGTPRQEAPDGVSENTPRIVIVEDEAPLLKVLARMLRQAGYAVSPCCDLAGAQAAWRSHADTCLVLTDMMLGAGESGLDVVDRIRNDGLDVPVLFMSGHPVTTHRPGTELHLSKPFTQAQLLQLVDRVLRDHA